MVSLTYNKAFQWKEYGNVFYKGYFIPSSIYDTSEMILQALNNCESLESFVSILDCIDGCFAIVINKEEKTFFAVDRIRTFPLFYEINGEFISDKAESVREWTKRADIDELLVDELRAKRTTAPGRTVFQDIMQLKAGAAGMVEAGNIKIKHYYRHIQCSREKLSEEQNSQKFTSVLNLTFKNLIATIKNGKIILPLSGGYDSRLIAAMLYENGIKNVFCYTYGVETDYEVQFSKKVAEKLGYSWKCIPYTEEEWKEVFDDNNVSIKEYFNDAHNHCNIPHLQEYIALKRLIDMGDIQKGDIVIPGFCGDFHAGSFTDLTGLKSISIKGLVDFTYVNHYVNYRYEKKKEYALKQYLKKYYASLGYEIKDRNSIIAAYQEWCIEGRVAMWTVNSVRIYEHFGLEFRLPQWQREYIDFWYTLDNEYRFNCSFYKKYLLNGIFKTHDIDFIKPESSNTHSNVIKSMVATSIKKKLIKKSVKSGKDFYRRNNLNNYNIAALILYGKLNNKQLFQNDSLSVHAMEALWWCEYMYNKGGNSELDKNNR